MSSQAQDDQRTIFEAAALRWNANLTDAQRLAWRAFTDRYPRQDVLGQTYAPSGQNRHAACNAITNTYNGFWLDDPPLDLHCHQPTGVIILVATAAPQSLLISMEGVSDDEEYWEIHAAPLTNAGRSNVNHLWRPCANGSDHLPYSYDAIGEYTAKFSALAPGKRVHVKLRVANVYTGTISCAVTDSLLVT